MNLLPLASVRRTSVLLRFSAGSARRRYRLALFGLALGIAGLSACGQTGPLFQPPVEQAPAEASETAPEESGARTA